MRCHRGTFDQVLTALHGYQLVLLAAISSGAVADAAAWCRRPPGPSLGDAGGHRRGAPSDRRCRRPPPAGSRDTASVGSCSTGRPRASCRASWRGTPSSATPLPARRPPARTAPSRCSRRANAVGEHVPPPMLWRKPRALEIGVVSGRDADQGVEVAGVLRDIPQVHPLAAGSSRPRWSSA